MGILSNLRESRTERELREQLKIERWQSQFVTESMRELESSMQDEGWRRMSMSMDREFTRSGLNELMQTSRAMYLSHPLIQRAVNVRTFYTFGQGMEVEAADKTVDNEVVEPMMADEGNRAELFSHQARTLTDIDQQLDGNTFMAMFTDTRGDVSVRSIQPDQIIDIITDPDDYQQIWYYRRVWTQRVFDQRTGHTNDEMREALYPDWRYDPASRPTTAGGIEIQWDAPIIHQRTGGLKHQQWGFPETYAALDWARAYRKFLEDWHTIVASLARFSWRMTTKGSKVPAAKQRLGSTITKDNPRETNPPPAAGSVFIGSESDNLTPIPKSGAATSAEDGKPARLMVGAAMDLPDTILSGDADQGNLATAKSLDRPTELAIANRQQLWADFYQNIFKYAIRAKQRAGHLGDVEDTSVRVSFPPILEHDVQQSVAAIVTAATLDGKVEAGTMPREEVSRLLMQALGVEDVQQAIDALDEDERADLAQAVEGLTNALTAE